MLYNNIFYQNTTQWCIRVYAICVHSFLTQSRNGTELILMRRINAWRLLNHYRKLYLVYL